MEEMLQLLAGLSPRAAVETNSVANYFLADQLIKDLGDMRGEISEKIREKVCIIPVMCVIGRCRFLKYLNFLKLSITQAYDNSQLLRQFCKANTAQKSV